eukprot:11177357-Lingulodinium_polyedra.AAC.1
MGAAWVLLWKLLGTLGAAWVLLGRVLLWCFGAALALLGRCLGAAWELLGSCLGGNCLSAAW